MNNESKIQKSDFFFVSSFLLSSMIASKLEL